jgi:CheY-like chemotaxis protein
MQPSDARSRVLLVDDDKVIRHMLCTLLEHDGYEVLAAGDGPEGLTICRQSTRPVELLVTDYNMPKMSGLELARECSLLFRELSVLYISGSRPDPLLQADLQAHGRGFLAKPFRVNELLSKARELLLLEPLKH